MNDLAHYLGNLELGQTHLRGTVVPSRRKVFDETVHRTRLGLATFWERHGRLPETLNELIQYGVGVSRLRNLAAIEARGKGGELGVVAFLDHLSRTTDEDLRKNPNISHQTVFSLNLIRAIYRGPQSLLAATAVPQRGETAVQWAQTATSILRERGFTAEQMVLLRSDANIRRAVRAILRDGPTS